MTYDEAIKHIENSSRRRKLYPIYLRIERMKLLFEALGIDPAAPCIHIAGTSGKGSTSSLCAAVLQEAGYRVGLHTTPHLQTPRERMQVNGLMPSEEEFADLTLNVTKTSLLIEESHSYGAYNSQEILFAVAALHFHRLKVDIFVAETFMGGQYDPTNVVLPLVSVVTNVDLDHTRLLGKTVEAITMVKAGVIKPNTPFITAARQPGVLSILKQRCVDVGAPCIIIGQDNKHRAKMIGQKGSMLSVEVLNNLFANLHIRLLGKHQINNSIMVLYIVQVLRTRGWLIADESIRQAFAKSFVPGRLEIMQEEPLIVLDGAHNPAKTKALSASLKHIFKDKKAILVISMKKGKDYGQSLKYLLPLAQKIILTSFSRKKAHSTSTMARHIKAHNVPVVTRLNPVKALELAKRQAKQDNYICVTGSLYLVGMLRNQWHPYEKTDYSDSLDVTGWPARATGEPIRQAEIDRILKRSRHAR